MKQKKSVKPELSHGKRIIFNLTVFFLPVIILLSAELSLRIFHYGKDFSLFIQHPDKRFQNYKIVNPDIGAKYFQNLEYTSPRNDLFTINKEKNSFRVFVMGSSTVVGFPYGQNLMFSRILQSRLQTAYPGKKIEMINTAITAINSYTLLDFMDDILAEKPDAILFYEGHNEYYGAFGVGSNEGIGRSRTLVLLHLKLMDLKIYQLIQNTIKKLNNVFKETGQDSKRGTLMSRIVKKADIAYQSKEYYTGLEQFRTNMSAILEKASKKKVPVFISTVVSNISDIKPFGSVNPEAGQSADEAYKKAESAKKQGDFIQAKELYSRARDMDCVRFRASSDINNVIEELAKQHKAYLIPMLKTFEDNSPNSLVGNNLITEHVHPNISGYFLMADAFYTSIAGSGLIDSEPDKFTMRSSVSFRNSYGYTSLDSMLGHHLIENLKYHWPFRDESASYLDYKELYKPVGTIDSLAFSIMKTKNANSIDGHLNLIKIYIARHELIDAYREYKAIIQIAPATPELLRDAASFFISAGDLPLALKCFNQSLEFEPSYFASFRAGEIYLIQNDYALAAQYFTKAFKTADDDTRLKILAKLYLTYIYAGKSKEANQVYQTVRQLKPDFKVQIPPKSYSFGSYIPIHIREGVDKANELEKVKKSDEALDVLLMCIETDDAPSVNRMIGVIYSQKKEFEKASFYLQKSYPWFKFEPAFLSFMIRVNLSCAKHSEAGKALDQLKLIDPKNNEIQEFERILKGQ